MRRSDRQVTSYEGIKNILDHCRVCRIAAADKEGLFIVPLNYGYTYDQDGKLTFYFHSAKEGRKVTAFGTKAAVAFELDCELGLIEGESACAYGYAYQSIMGTGELALVTEPQQKQAALALLMQHQTGQDFTFTPQMANSVLVYQLEALSFTGKQHHG